MLFILSLSVRINIVGIMLISLLIFSCEDQVLLRGSRIGSAGLVQDIAEKSIFLEQVEAGQDSTRHLRLHAVAWLSAMEPSFE